MTVVIGVVTVAVVPLGMVTVADVIGVFTVTVAATVAGNVGIRSVDGRAVCSCEEPPDVRVAGSPEPWAGARAAFAFGPAVGLE